MSKHRLDQMDASFPIHGGDLYTVAKHYGIPVEKWLDLSTGINPFAYPVPTIPKFCFTQLPYQSPSFTDAVVSYYGESDFIALSGSQSAIQWLPEILNVRKNLPVLLPEIGYQEHAVQWGEHNAPVIRYPSIEKTAMVAAIDHRLSRSAEQHVVVINPNNPTAVSIEQEQLLRWAKKLKSGACLIVDEAFMDTTPENSLLSLESRPQNIIVLRSFGKFFGLPGIRLGFAFAAPSILEALQQKAGLWPISGPTQYIASKALRDQTWHRQTADSLVLHSTKIKTLLGPFLEGSSIGIFHCPFFISYQFKSKDALMIYQRLIECSILSRLIFISEYESIIRIGVVHLNCENRTRLDKALKNIRVNLRKL